MAETKVYKIFELTEFIKQTLEQRIGAVWVEGEISNFTLHSSGHMYFSLKDEASQIKAVMFRTTNMKLRFTPAQGMRVLALGYVTVYERSGAYQIVVQAMQPAGLGALQLAFEQLKQKLDAEGLFDPKHKKNLPFLPKRVGVVTSPTGAVIRDIIHVISRRCPGTEIILAPVRVQGDGAAGEIAAAIELFNRQKNADVLIIGRGGGSLEDLWPFNEEKVARAIFASQIPTISAVGHEVDFTMADFVADLRAPTPSAAAELAVPDKEALIGHIREMSRRLRDGMQNRLSLYRQQVARIRASYGFRRPADLIRQRQQTLDHVSHRLEAALKTTQERRRHQFQQTLTRLNSLNPLNALERGYVLCEKLPDKKLVTRADALKKGDKVQLTFRQGAVICRVESSAASAQQQESLEL